MWSLSNFSKKDTGFHIEGFPDAVKAIKLDGKLAWQLASCSLHRYDLKNSLAILESINGIDESAHIIRELLWHQAIVTYIKCFRSGKARTRLNEKKIYREEPAEALEAFEYFTRAQTSSPRRSGGLTGGGRLVE